MFFSFVWSFIGEKEQIYFLILIITDFFSFIRSLWSSSLLNTHCIRDEQEFLIFCVLCYNEPCQKLRTQLSRFDLPTKLKVVTVFFFIFLISDPIKTVSFRNVFEDHMNFMFYFWSFKASVFFWIRLVGDHVQNRWV